MSNCRSRGFETPRFTGSAFAFRACEQRLDTLCDLIDEELRTGAIGGAALGEFARRITGEVDQVMAEETSWFDEAEFLN